MPGTGTTQLIVNILAVLGGFLTGFLLTGLLANLLDRAVFFRKSPNSIHRAVRILGGIALAILVAAILFGHGEGWNLFGGAAQGKGEASEDGEKQPISAPIMPAVEKSPDSKPEYDHIRITVLGGADVKAERFYLVNDDPAAKTMAELKVFLLMQKDSQTKPPKLEIRFDSRNPLPTEHPAVRMLTRWSREVAGLEFSFVR